MEEFYTCILKTCTHLVIVRTMPLLIFILLLIDVVVVERLLSEIE